MISHRAIKIAAVSLLTAGAIFVPGLVGNGWLQRTGVAEQRLAEPAFEVSLRQAEVRLSGATVSREHERLLHRSLVSLFPDRAIETDFSAYGVAPSYWQDLSLAVLRSLADARFANASIGAESVSIGAVFAGSGWDRAQRNLEDDLPAAVTAHFDIVSVDESTSSRDNCGHSLSRFVAGPINFEESTDRLRSSAYPRLDRVVAIAESCARAGIHVIGHTDSSGDEDWNEALSLSRAIAVRDYLVSGGLEAARIKATGAGSTKPIASNDTRYGRSENRRIEIAFIEAD